MNVKDNFSAQASEYSTYRPGYPSELYDFILSLTPGRDCALDVATGSGQVAFVLSHHFDKVYATDISQQQINNSAKRDNIFYSVTKAESTSFDDTQFDLVTAGQAAHWFNLNSFYTETQRLLKPGGVLALFGYKLPTIDILTDAVVIELYDKILGPYWDPERKLVDNGYETLYFPFPIQKHPEFKTECNWTLSELTGFLSTWSAVQHYKRQHGINPVNLILEKLRDAWGMDLKKKIVFPVFIRAARF